MNARTPLPNTKAIIEAALAECGGDHALALEFVAWTYVQHLARERRKRGGFEYCGRPSVRPPKEHPEPLAAFEGGEMSDTAMLGNSGYERREADFYSTPAWCTEALCDAVELPERIWEPASGANAIVNVLRARDYSVFASDIEHGEDFLTRAMGAPAAVITNPPYTLAEEFTRHALKITEPALSLVAMLLRHEYDCAKTRVDLFNKPPFSKKLVLTKRPKWIEGPLKASPRHNYAWYIWDWKHTGPATIEYGP